VSSIASANGFQLSSRNPNFGKGSMLIWNRDRGWRKDELRLLFLWAGYPRSRGVSGSIGTSIVLPHRSVPVDGYRTAWIARKSPDELTIRESAERAPADVVETLRSDVVASIAWLDRTYATPASALVRLRDEDRNGAGAGHRDYPAVVFYLEGLGTG
jgi:hypothetical protein